MNNQNQFETLTLRKALNGLLDLAERRPGFDSANYGSAAALRRDQRRSKALREEAGSFIRAAFYSAVAAGQIDAPLLIEVDGKLVPPAAGHWFGDVTFITNSAVAYAEYHATQYYPVEYGRGALEAARKILALHERAEAARAAFRAKRDADEAAFDAVCADERAATAYAAETDDEQREAAAALARGYIRRNRAGVFTVPVHRMSLVSGEYVIELKFDDARDALAKFRDLDENGFESSRYVNALAN